MLGDTGVAVHPDDLRYKKLIGKHVVLPIVGRKIQLWPMTMSTLAGFGAKITPARLTISRSASDVGLPL